MIHCSLGQFIEIAAKILYAASSPKKPWKKYNIIYNFKKLNEINAIICEVLFLDFRNISFLFFFAKMATDPLIYQSRQIDSPPVHGSRTIENSNFATR